MRMKLEQWCVPRAPNTHQRTGDDVTEVGFSLDACVCKSGFYSPTANHTGTACEPCPVGATCTGGVSRPMSKSLYYGYAHPYEEYFMRCHTYGAVPQRYPTSSHARSEHFLPLFSGSLTFATFHLSTLFTTDQQ